MLSWFSRSDDNHKNQPELTDEPAQAVEPEPESLSRLDVGAHDAALAHLHAKSPPPAAGPSRLKLPSQEALTTPYVAASSDAVKTVYDPFNGQPLGILATKDGEVLDKNEDELWSHLASILKLQSEVARLHVNMEGIASDGKGEWNPVHETKWDWGQGEETNEVDDEAERKRAREEEFARLSEKFHSRSRAVKGIMEKLSELSGALNTFHALRTPHIDFTNNNSRSNTMYTNTNSDGTSRQATADFHPVNVEPLTRSTAPTYPTRDPFAGPEVLERPYIPSGLPKSALLGQHPLLVETGYATHAHTANVVESPVSGGTLPSPKDYARDLRW